MCCKLLIYALLPKLKCCKYYHFCGFIIWNKAQKQANRVNGNSTLKLYFIQNHSLICLAQNTNC